MHDIPKWKYKVFKPTGIADGQVISISTREVLFEAQKYGIIWEEIIGTGVFRLNYNGRISYFHEQISPATSQLGFDSCLNKSTTRAFLTHADVTIAQGFPLSRIDTQEYWIEVFHALVKPLVVKPTHGNQGRSVFMNIQDLDSYVAAVKESFSFSNETDAGVIVEETAPGTEYRVLATREKVIGIINRIPANVIGDGKSTISELIKKKNSDPRRSDNPQDPLVKINVDQHVFKYLDDHSLTIDSIPAVDEQVLLRGNSNISTGGDSIDVTDIAHQSVKDIAIRIMRSIPGLEFAGIDLMTKDITAEQSSKTYSLIEVNASPGFSIHDFPYQGKKRRAGREMLFLIFPELRELPQQD